MVDINKISIGGNIVADPNLVTTKNGNSIVEFRFCCNGRTKNPSGEWVEQPVFMNGKIFGFRAEAFAKYHRKGSKCLLFGEIREDRWEDKKTGKPRTQLYLRVEDWFFADSKPKGGRTGTGGSGEYGGKSADTFEASNDDFTADETPF